MNKTNEIIENLKTTVYESIGKASMCWQPIPSVVFDEKLANEVSAYLMAEIESFYVQLKSATQVKEIPPTPDSSTGMREELQNDFLEYVVEARNSFSKYINSREWETVLRTECESLLIAYDQMKDKLLSITPKEGEGWEKKISDAWDAGYKKGFSEGGDIDDIVNNQTKEDYFNLLKEEYNKLLGSGK